MKSYLKKSLKTLDKYLKETPQEVIDKELESCKLSGVDGPTLDKYLKLYRGESK